MLRYRFGSILLAAAALLCRAGDDAQQRLAGRAFSATPLLADLEELCDRIGGRPTGSPECERAIEWAAAKFKAAGVDTVALESFPVPQAWAAETAEAECLAPEKFPLRIAAAPFSASTGAALEAPLVDAGDGSPQAIAALGDRARGAIALVTSREMKTLDDLFDEYFRSGPMLAAARLAAQGAVRVRLRLVNRTGGPFESRNVVAEIRGRERPEEVVLLGAHLDSWELGTGAEDNGANAAMVIDAARAIHELQRKPRRTIRFVLFTGEEQGMWGSAGYVLRHASEMDRHVAAVVFDMGSGRTSGFFLNGREDLRQPLAQALAGLSGLDAAQNPPDAIDGTDNFDFLLSGVPNLVANQEAAPYLPDYHAESDTLDRVNARELKANAALASALVWWLAESPERFGRRLSRAEVEKLLADTKLDVQMRAFGQWDDWQSRRRGASR